jgi:hypothetical protein
MLPILLIAAPGFKYILSYAIIIMARSNRTSGEAGLGIGKMLYLIIADEALG